MDRMALIWILDTTILIRYITPVFDWAHRTILPLSHGADLLGTAGIESWTRFEI
jgi:hypothetical protein